MTYKQKQKLDEIRHLIWQYRIDENNTTDWDKVDYDCKQLVDKIEKIVGSPGVGE